MQAGPGQPLGLIGLDEVTSLSIFFRGKSAAWPLTLISRTEPPSATGEEKTPKPFISACNQFKYLDLLYRNQQEEEKKEDLATAAEAKNPETAANRAAPAPGRTKISSGCARPLMPSSRNFLTKRDGFPPDSWAISLGNDFRILMCVITDIPS